MTVLSEKSNGEIVKLLASNLEHVLRFSSINRKWPEQKEFILDLIDEARRRVEAARANDARG